MTPRLLISAPASGMGKTTLVCALLQALVNRGLRPMACKSGPDYIDPMFHSEIIGAKSGNLDLFFFPPSLTRALLRENARGCDLTVLEGAMGFYDGIADGSDASAYDLARKTETPVLLVLDGRGRALSAAAEAQGFQRFRPDSNLAGVVFNRCSPMLYPRLAALVTGETGLPCFGYLPELPDCEIESRHLGLRTAGEIGDLKEKLQRLAQAAEKSLDLEGLLRLARSAPPLLDPLPEIAPVTARRPRIALARDRAFCFYYADALRLLEALGAELVEFSPLEDENLPENCAGLYLGGGYPELYARRLSENRSMRSCVRAAVTGGLPTLAECGGFLYLQQSLEDADGVFYPMVGALPGESRNSGRLRRFGYVTLRAEKDGLLLNRGETIPAHEFHYWDSSAPGADFLAQKPQSSRQWQAGVQTASLYAGFPHFHLWSKPVCAERFVRKCAEYQSKERKG